MGRMRMRTTKRRKKAVWVGKEKSVVLMGRKRWCLRAMLRVSISLSYEDVFATDAI
jgi:hypothetical protein